jgi:aspartate-semialdehyde dehydrogenase
VKVVVVGATGAVGTEILAILEQRSFPLGELVAVASARSAGRRLDFAGGPVPVAALAPEVFAGADLALFDVPDDVARAWAPVAAAAGAVVVDNSAAWRMEPDVPLVVPEINSHEIAERPRGIIASPNCTTLAMVVPLAPLHGIARLEAVIAASYQAAAGAGRRGVDELWDQTELIAKERDAVTAGLARKVVDGGPAFGRPLAMNVVPRCGSLKEHGYTSEELKLCYETRKILGLPGLPVSATCVRVPVVVGHGVAVHARFERPVSAAEARDVVARSPGVALQDDAAAHVYPTPLDAAGNDPCYVGRIRQDLFDEHALHMFCVADNLRKGAALNTVQIAELLLRAS